MSRISVQHGIETTYRNYKFRSRLEAKWAVFFDLCGWSWSYEPMDFNGWIPDFAIGQWPWLVEVKPFFRDDEWTDARTKIRESGCRRNVLLFGADPCLIAANNWREYDDAPLFGWSYELETADGQSCYECYDLHFGMTEGNGFPGLCTLDMGWNPNKIWIPPENHTHPNKWSRVWLSREQTEESLNKRWASACNMSQWIKIDESRETRDGSKSA